MFFISTTNIVLQAALATDTLHYLGNSGIYSVLASEMWSIVVQTEEVVGGNIVILLVKG